MKRFLFVKVFTICHEYVSQNIIFCTLEANLALPNMSYRAIIAKKSLRDKKEILQGKVFIIYFLFKLS